ncbi:anthranilate phosphoribosyltransferase [Nocardiopsis sp. HUAS JQ3]|uniref:anthranilate phosphoribosyltransferase n=1 Tax=Nocardiopsis sp. HUAS JQ3 TaxID=3061629 RepID=UPI0023AA15E7|nr:anthranilate phosphoribosyltransferase [Nocardiopsis sp. HUAS JQ3]WDZ89295.1 anthranilate phosphoribosyltransferase [Nocardiopsis sp. HUAS JQ3]
MNVPAANPPAGSGAANSDEPSAVTERTWSNLITALLSGRTLSADDTAWAMNEIMSEAATDAQIAGFAIALRAKGESVSEVTGLARGMLDNAVRIHVPGPTLDIVGTGGDRAHTVNVSTMAAIVASAAGARVVKHGNRAASSSCGTADVLERLGVVLDLPPELTVRVAEEAGIAFCFAPVFHPSFRFTAKPRRELAVPTVFNFLGPLTNPAQPTTSAIGVFDERMCEVIAGVFARRGSSALVFRGDDGLDELTTTTTSTVWVVGDGAARRETLDPADLGIARSRPEDLRGGDVGFNAQAVRDLLAGRTGPVRDAVLLNAGAALAAVDGIRGPLLESVRAGYERAAAAVDSGAAERALERWVETSQQYAKSL